MNVSRILSDLKAERNHIDKAIAAIRGITADGTRKQGRKPRRRLSAAARRRIAQAKKKWWAERKKKI